MTRQARALVSLDLKPTSRPQRKAKRSSTPKKPSFHFKPLSQTFRTEKVNFKEGVFTRSGRVQRPTQRLESVPENDVLVIIPDDDVATTSAAPTLESFVDLTLNNA